MKQLNFLLNSFFAKIFLFLLTLAFGIGIAVLFYPENRSSETPFIPAQDTQSAQAKTKDTKSFTTPNIVQSTIVNFPVGGRVVVQSIEEIGKFPQMVFTSERTSEVLHRSSIEDEDKWLIPEKDSSFSQPGLRFLVVRSASFESPIIISVAVAPGGSDNHFYLTLFGEINGKIKRINQTPLLSHIQGGFHLGYLNEKFGYGLAIWNFLWEDGTHYDNHKYEIVIFKLQNGELKEEFRKISKKKYNLDTSFNSLRELGIKARDQREKIPIIQEYLN